MKIHTATTMGKNAKAKKHEVNITTMKTTTATTTLPTAATTTRKERKSSKTQK